MRQRVALADQVQTGGSSRAQSSVSFLLGAPVLLASIAAVAKQLPHRLPGQVLHWLTYAVTVFLLVPTAYLMVCVALGLDVAGAVLLAVLTSIGAWVLATCFEAPEGRRWILPAGAGAAALLCVILGLVTVRTNASRPAGFSRVYAVDVDRPGSAWRGPKPESASPRCRTQRCNSRRRSS